MYQMYQPVWLWWIEILKIVYYYLYRLELIKLQCIHLYLFSECLLYVQFTSWVQKVYKELRQQIHKCLFSYKTYLEGKRSFPWANQFSKLRRFYCVQNGEECLGGLWGSLKQPWLWDTQVLKNFVFGLADTCFNSNIPTNITTNIILTQFYQYKF